ncbi:MAG TPA: SlyX family protein [Deltaproteobacteria bacterium]|nr:SlyX family protein [Deltaproteobacteria bacterium]HOM29535.1 SlyX family protein [Deltaproteobacteria bacterium]HPP80634.1 SlyX family protein [Deltaproteobacteria bacterium]
MSEKRFTTLETMVAYHEDTLQKLNDVVYKQQVMIDKLQDKLEALTRLVLGEERPVVDEAEK